MTIKSRKNSKITMKNIVNFSCLVRIKKTIKTQLKQKTPNTNITESPKKGIANVSGAIVI